jgi:uncharacterized protein (TIGR03083 family)
VGHLARYASVYRESIARALKGDNAPPLGPDGLPSTREAFLALTDADQRALAEQAPRDLLREFSRSGDELTEMLRCPAPADLDLPAWHYSGPLTIGILAAYRLYELAFHGWDVRSTVDPAARIHPELCPFLVGIVRRLQPSLCEPERSITGTCRFEVDGQTWTSRVDGGKLAEVSDPGAPDAVVRTDASTFLLLVTSRQTPADCADRLAIEGERERVERMLGTSCFRV